MDNFSIKTRIICGEKALQKIKDYEDSKTMIITDKIMVKIGIINKVTDLLKETGSEYIVFDDVEPNPSLGTVSSGTKILSEFQPHVIIALGGGSPIDAAKAMIYFAVKSGRLKKKPIFLAIPTTSGTGSEVTSYSVVTDTVKGLKVPISEELMYPDYAILDPEFTKTLPKSVVADTGLDALTHAIEAYVCNNGNSFSKMFALNAIKLIFKNLIKNYMDIESVEYRIGMQKAACMAGIAFSNSGLGINHSIAHSIGGKFNIPHGKINAILLPYVIRANGESGAADSYNEISKELGFVKKDEDNGVEALAVFTEILKQTFSIPTNLKAYGIDRDEYMGAVDSIIENVKNDTCTKTNPVKLSDTEIKKLLIKIYDDGKKGDI